MTGKLNELAFGLAGALVGMAVMLFISLLGLSGLYRGGVAMMQQWHMFYSLTPLGVIGGLIEASVISFIATYLFAFSYNKLNKK